MKVSSSEKSINSNKINTNEVNINIKENKESKEKINPPVIKNKVAPIKRTKYFKKIPEKEEKIKKQKLKKIILL